MLRAQNVLFRFPCCSFSRLPKYNIEEELQLKPKVVIKLTTNNAIENIPKSSTESFLIIIIFDTSPKTIAVILNKENEKNLFLANKNENSLVTLKTFLLENIKIAFIHIELYLSNR